MPTSFTCAGARINRVWITVLVCLTVCLSPALTSAQTRIDSSQYYRYSFTLPDNQDGFWLVPYPYLNELDPSSIPHLQVDRSLNTFATPGENEPVSFVIYATRNLENVDVGITNLVTGDQRLSHDKVTVRTVMRAPERRFYRSPPDEHIISNRFLPRFQSFDLADGHLRQIWLNIKVPKGTSAGHYAGTVRVSTEGGQTREIPLSVDVLSFQLKDNPEKKYGVYYRRHTENGPKSADLIRRELRDIQAHGGEIVIPGIGINYDKENDAWTPRYDEITRFLDLMKQAGFRDTPVVVRTGLEWLAEQITEGHSEKMDHEAMAEKVLQSQELRGAAIRGLEGLADLQKRYPQFEFLITHMDEVFNQGRLPLYIALTKIAEEGPTFRRYITLHTLPGTDSLRKAIDPYVDVRGHHGATFEGWLNRGNTIQQYEDELARSGDEAWQYHNRVGIWMTPERQRVINGLYSWVNPFAARTDWIYNAYTGNPLNDLDGREENGWNHDYGYAFPTQGDSTIVPTLDWEAWREGITDLNYLYTLQQLISAYEEAGRGNEAAGARTWLETLRDSLPKPQNQERRKGARAQLESPPFTAPTAKQFDFEDYQSIRYIAARYIEQLQAGL